MTGDDVTWPEVAASDPEVMSFHRKRPGEGCRRPKTHLLCDFQLLQGCDSQEVAGRLMTGNGVTWPELPEVTLK